MPADQTAPQDAEIPEIIDDRYHFVRLLGEGRLGRTLEVRDAEAGNQPVMLKLLWTKFSEIPEFGQILTRCMESSRGILGEHINPVREFSASDDCPLYLTTDLVDGESLAHRLVREETLQPRQALQIARQLLRALTVGHEKSVVHGAVTPGNVFLSFGTTKTRENPYGIDVRLLDFGLTELADSEAAGVPDMAYLSPEKMEGKSVDPRADVFSVGMLCCEMLLGRTEFQSGLSESLRQAADEGDPDKFQEFFKDVPRGRGTGELLLRALRKDREERYPTAKHFQQAIETCAAFQETTRTPLSVEISIVALLLFSIVASWFGWSQYEGAKESRGLMSRRIEILAEEVEELRGGTDSGATSGVDEAAARAFDEFLRLVEARRPVLGFALLNPGEDDGGIPGMPFLAAVEGAAAAVQEARTAAGKAARVYLVEQARGLLEEVDRLRRAFPLEARSWLGRRFSEDGHGEPERLGRLDDVVADLKARVEALEKGLPTPPRVVPAGTAREQATGPERSR